MGEEGPRIGLVPDKTHEEWGRRLKRLTPEQVHDEAEEIIDRSYHLGIWSRGGMVPLQPFILPKKVFASLSAISSELHNLLISYATTVADGDVRRLADHVNWPDSEKWVLDAKTRIGPVVGSSRADVMVADGVPKVLEMNVGTCLNGSTSTPVLEEALRETSIGQDLLRRQTPTEIYVYRLAAWLLKERRHSPDRVALVSSLDASDEGSTRWAEHQIRLLAARGITADLVPIEEADVVDDTLTWGGHRYPQAVRFFMLNGPLLEYRDTVVALEKAAKTEIYGSYLSQLFTSKSLLADVLQLPDLPEQARRTLAHVPWTARLREEPCWREGDRVDPAEWALAEKDRSVLKPSHLYGSRGVTMGRSVTESEWEQRVQDALESGDYVVQELVEPDSWQASYWDLNEQRLATIDMPVVLGPFSVDGKAAGTFVQQPTSTGWPGLPRSGEAVSLGVAIAN